MATNIPSPVAQWVEAPTSGAAATLAALVPVKTSAGYWIFLPKASLAAVLPVGAQPGALVDTGSGYSTLLTTTTVGRRITRAPSGTVFIY